jgi:hypothetical protein
MRCQQIRERTHRIFMTTRWLAIVKQWLGHVGEWGRVFLTACGVTTWRNDSSLQIVHLGNIVCYVIIEVVIFSLSKLSITSSVSILFFGLFICVFNNIFPILSSFFLVNYITVSLNCFKTNRFDFVLTKENEYWYFFFFFD